MGKELQLAVLKTARELLETRGWCQEALVRHVDGTELSLSSYDLVSGKIEGGPLRDEVGACCASGAVYLARIMLGETALMENVAHGELYPALPDPFDSIVEYNDHEDRTKEDILRLFDESIARLEALDGHKV